jgi:hypothetical protein
MAMSEVLIGDFGIGVGLGVAPGLEGGCSPAPSGSMAITSGRQESSAATVSMWAISSGPTKTILASLSVTI